MPLNTPFGPEKKRGGKDKTSGIIGGLGGGNSVLSGSIGRPTPSRPSKPVNSINDLRGASGAPVTSVAHINDTSKYSVSDTETSQEVRDQLRYEYGQRMRSQAKKKKEAAQTPTQSDRYTINTGGAGAQFTDKGRSGFKRRLGKFLYEKKQTYKNLSQSDREKLHDIISKRVSHKTTGSSISRKDRITMRKDAWKAYKKGDISREDFKDMKNIIKRLQS